MDFVARAFNAVFHDGLSRFFACVRQCGDPTYIVYSDLRLFQDYQNNSKQEENPTGKSARAVPSQPQSDIIRRKTNLCFYFDSDSVYDLLRDSMPVNLHHEYMHEVFLRCYTLVARLDIFSRDFQFCD